ncbi:LPS assembly lipoprotein LptE [Campylobacter fetus]|uniref:Penicillin-binding protein n=1 Tax=Campylobacter fetus subsp. testudinum TaxID=1507806 RepID=A0AAX0HC32_CAMFE|nr:LPS assembly lipoprotein LptE [Campylobacter fetus]AGZ81590.1 putative lipooligosaccharide transport system, OM component (LptE family) [Campylobacter fetus subsp. testudinum 03-427]AJB45332.1 penicillin-binding protein [Campylobacter fetus subsp. testudinum]AVK80998.1 penicillin-binding protein [Campylobacter fetus subsp. testudinum]EAI4321433.1 penicillin-binding protein [Campylobacter fetus]EAI4390689.1 penicillin-binding protein [Campylobacter fetus]
MKTLLNLIVVLFFMGCGYKPVSVITADVLDESVWVDVIMSKTDPENTVAIKDSVREAMIKRLGRNLTTKEEANSIIIASIKSLTFNAILYDQFGYVTAYKTNLIVDYKVKLKNGDIKYITTSGDYDFRITKRINNTRFTDSVISDKDRFEAIKNASLQSFDEFISRLAIEGLRDGKYSK